MTKVAIVIPVYNAGEYLIDSVDSAIRQSYKNKEIIVIDDGSTDNSVEKLSAVYGQQVLIFKRENGGKPSVLNWALDNIKSDYFCVLDADDIMDQERVQKQVEFLEINRNIDIVFCGHRLLINGKNLAPRYIEKTSDECMIDILKYRMPAHDPTAMYRTANLRGFRYDEKLPGVEGYDFIMKVGEKRKAHVLEDCLYTYRIHEESITHKNLEKRLRLLWLAKNKVRKRRNLKPIERFIMPRNITNSLRENGVSSHFLESVIELKKKGKYREALGVAGYSIRMHPLDIDNWKPFLAFLIPAKILSRIR